MPVSDTFRDFVLEQLAPLGPVRFRRMFGGGGVFLDGVMFGLIGDDVLYLKADDGNRALFEAEGMGPFVYRGSPAGKSGGKSQTMSYWQTPERLNDEPDELLAFARAAVAAARRGVRGKAGKTLAAPGKMQAAEPAKAKSRRRKLAP
jgi:DNA transformation protein and related proteins